MECPDEKTARGLPRYAPLTVDTETYTTPLYFRATPRQQRFGIVLRCLALFVAASVCAVYVLKKTNDVSATVAYVSCLAPRPSLYAADLLYVLVDPLL